MNGSELPTSTIGILAFIVAGLLGCIVLLVRTLVTVKAGATEIAQVNAAVNNVGPGGVRLYDRVTNIGTTVEALRAAQEDFARRGWAALPSDLSTAAGLTEVIRSIEHDLRDVQQRLIEHDAWERTQKHLD